MTIPRRNDGFGKIIDVPLSNNSGVSQISNTPPTYVVVGGGESPWAPGAGGEASTAVPNTDRVAIARCKDLKYRITMQVTRDLFRECPKTDDRKDLSRRRCC